MCTAMDEYIHMYTLLWLNIDTYVHIAMNE